MLAAENCIGVSLLDQESFTIKFLLLARCRLQFFTVKQIEKEVTKCTIFYISTDQGPSVRGV